MSEYIVTVPKGTLTCCNGIQLLPTPGLYHFWGSSCPKMHTHMNDTAFLLYPEFKKKKKKIDLPTLPISGLYVQNLCSFLIGYPI